MNSTVDEEWANFISNNDEEDDASDCDNDDNCAHVADKLNNSIDFKNMCTISSKPVKGLNAVYDCADILNEPRDDVVPSPSEIYISTKSIIEYLNSPIDIKTMFWNVNIIAYSSQSEGIIKKQIKFNSLDMEELNSMQTRLKREPHYEEHIIKSINNPDGRIKFKDVRKLSVGMSKKDITNVRSKKKSAFYNCLVLILRLKIDGVFREFHIKIFNTGKIELPGMQIETTRIRVLSKIVEILQPHISTPVSYLDCGYTILINSNFNCGFYINREALYFILKNTYDIETIYDPCSYPGIQCKLYHDSVSGICLKNSKIGLTKVSFMIFRTGSILIVGMINEEALFKVYDYIKLLLQTEYHTIGQKKPMDDASSKIKKTPRKKMVSITILNQMQSC
jgi:hypothetical protein